MRIPPVPREQVDAAEGTMARQVDIETRRLMRKVARGLDAVTVAAGNPSPDDLNVIHRLWAEIVDGVLSGIVRRSYRAGVDWIAKHFGPDAQVVLDAPVEYMQQAKNRLRGIGDVLWEHAREGLVEGIAAGEDIGQLRARVQQAAEVGSARAQVIARTEVLRANVAGSFGTMLALNEPGTRKEWLATHDSRTRPSHREVDGQSWDLTTPFQVGNGMLQYPTDPTGPPEEVIQCRCDLAYDFPDEALVAAGWDPARHPRDHRGRFIDTDLLPEVSERDVPGHERMSRSTLDWIVAQRQPVKGAKAKDVNRWRKDANRAGRRRKSKREAYVRDAEENLARYQRELQEAEAALEAKLKRKRVAKREWDDWKRQELWQERAAVRWREEQLEEMRTSQAEFLQGEGQGWEHTGIYDENRPLATYGGMLHIGAGGEHVHTVLSRLEQIPAILHLIVARHMAEGHGTEPGIYVGNFDVTRLDHLADMRDQSPRGWSPGDTWEKVNGVHSPGRGVMAVGLTANSKERAGATAAHEFGHALDTALGNLSGKDDWLAIWSQHKRSHLTWASPYYLQDDGGNREAWGEAFRIWAETNHDDPDNFVTAIHKEMGTSGPVALKMADYFGTLIESISLHTKPQEVSVR